MSQRLESRSEFETENIVWVVSPDILTDPKKYVHQWPSIDKTLAIVGDYKKLNIEGRSEFIQNWSHFLIENPRQLLYTSENLQLLSAVDSVNDYELVWQTLLTEIEHTLESQKVDPNIRPEKINELIECSLNSRDNPEANQMINKIIENMFTNFQDSSSLLNLYYQATWALVVTDDGEVRDELLEILNFDKSWAKIEVAKINYHLGQYALNDEDLKRYHSIEETKNIVHWFLQRHNQNKSANATDRIDFQDKNQSIPSGIKDLESSDKSKIYLENPQRFGQLQEHYHSFPTMEGGIDYTNLRIKAEEEGLLNQWPLNQILASDPLRDLTRQRFLLMDLDLLWQKTNIESARKTSEYDLLSEQAIEIDSGLSLKVSARNCRSFEEQGALVRMVIRIINGSFPFDKSDQVNQGFIDSIKEGKLSAGFQAVIDSDGRIIVEFQDSGPKDSSYGALSTRLEYTRPYISAEGLIRIQRKIQKLRSDIRKQAVRSLIYNGYEIVVSDHRLRHLGVRALTVRSRDKGHQIDGQIEIMGEKFGFLIGTQSLEFCQSDSIRRFTSAVNKAWFELLVLSHLKKMLCIKNEHLQIETVGNKVVKLKTREYLNRKETIKRLAKRRRPTQRAKDLYKESELRIIHGVESLDRYNEDNGYTIETGFRTYVKPIHKEPDLSGKPFKLSFSQVGDEIEEAISLSELSPDEIIELQKEITQDLL